MTRHALGKRHLAAILAAACLVTIVASAYYWNHYVRSPKEYRSIVVDVWRETYIQASEDYFDQEIESMESYLGLIWDGSDSRRIKVRVETLDDGRVEIRIPVRDGVPEMSLATLYSNLRLMSGLKLFVVPDNLSEDEIQHCLSLLEGYDDEKLFDETIGAGGPYRWLPADEEIAIRGKLLTQRIGGKRYVCVRSEPVLSIEAILSASTGDKALVRMRDGTTGVKFGIYTEDMRHRLKAFLRANPGGVFAWVMGGAVYVAPIRIYMKGEDVIISGNFRDQ